MLADLGLFVLANWGFFFFFVVYGDLREVRIKLLVLCLLVSLLGPTVFFVSFSFSCFGV